MSLSSLAERPSPSRPAGAIALRIDGELRDLSAPVPSGALAEPVFRDDSEALALIHHDTAHLLAEAVKELWPDTQVTIGPAIIKQRERIKRQTIEYRCLQHRKLAAQHQPGDDARTPLIYAVSCAKCCDDGQGVQAHVRSLH